MNHAVTLKASAMASAAEWAKLLTRLGIFGASDQADVADVTMTVHTVDISPS